MSRVERKVAKKYIYKLRRGRPQLCLHQQLNTEVEFSAVLLCKVSELYICCLNVQEFVHL